MHIINIKHVTLSDSYLFSMVNLLPIFSAVLHDEFIKTIRPHLRNACN